MEISGLIEFKFESKDDFWRWIVVCHDYYVSFHSGLGMTVWAFRTVVAGTLGNVLSFWYFTIWTNRIIVVTFYEMGCAPEHRAHWAGN